MRENSGFCRYVVEAFDIMECYAAHVGRHPSTFWDSIISTQRQRSSSPSAMRKLQYITTNIQCLTSQKSKGLILWCVHPRQDKNLHICENIPKQQVPFYKENTQ